YTLSLHDALPISTEACLGEWQVRRDAHDDGVGQFVGLGVEFAYRGGAGRSVDAREDIQHLALADEGRQLDIRQVGADQAERLGLLSRLRKVACNLDRAALEGYFSHVNS